MTIFSMGFSLRVGCPIRVAEGVPDDQPYSLCLPWQYLPLAGGGRGGAQPAAGPSDRHSDWHVGEPPYGPMQAAARARGIELGDLRARQFEPADFDRFDLILAMDGNNLREIEALRPAGRATPVRLFTDYAPETGADHVPDPYYTRDFDAALDLIEAAAEGLRRHLSAEA
jgi:protein-tyrosine phosphatase